MPLQKLPTVDLDNVNHRRGARERINQILDHSFDDSKAVTDFEKFNGIPVVNAAFRVFTPRRYGAVADGTTDDLVAFNRAILAASVGGGLCYVDCEGLSYAVSDTIQILQNVVLCNGVINAMAAFATEKAIVQMGITGGGALVRPAGAENLRVSTLTLDAEADGIVGIRFDSLVRSSWIRDCYAEMNEDANGTRFQIGFEFVAETQANAVGGQTGCYQNELSGSTAYNAYSAVVMRTRGTPSEQLADPECNGNKVHFVAYACIHSAIIIEEGAQDNYDIQFRADTFPSQLGSGTTIIVADVRGLYNEIDFHEEIGIRADTQYTLRWGSNAIYNTVKYHTLQVATARILDDAGNNKNVAIFSRPTQNIGGDLISHSYYTGETGTSIADPSTGTLRSIWIAPAPCTIIRCSAILDANLGAGTFTAYFAKNGTTSTDNDIIFSTGEGTTAKFLDGDPSAGSSINNAFKLAKGDRVEFKYSNSGTGGGVNCTSTMLVRFNSTEADG